MDYAERGTVEKTMDRLVENGTAISEGWDPEIGEMVVDGSFTPEGEAYFRGVLSGVLATIRTFSDGEAEFAQEDLEEIRRIASGREAELLSIIDAGD